jgi:hypothetical protein
MYLYLHLKVVVEDAELISADIPRSPRSLISVEVASVALRSVALKDITLRSLTSAVQPRKELTDVDKSESIKD